MIKTLFILLLVILLMWDLLWWAGGIKPTSPRHLRKILDNGESEPLLLDVRTSIEYSLFHIEQARNLPGLLRNPDDFQADGRERRIVLVCMSGHRAPLAAYLLKKRGFKNVSYLTWGMIGWVATGGKTVKGKE
jgi:rhodanese-related sulfurtransferase